ncbi:hypothetical protein [Variovorax sp. dw_954]|uniref:hypothetical protein n=1 Tax=Variovorax sp. dw_954 TaxID=2720078 RepID=UPI001BD1EDE2|nr:hypothetical protein [Variovorax sp. dw_954]
MKRRRHAGPSLIERALIEKKWHATTVRAQIHAVLSDNSDEFVNAAGRMLFVVLGALIAEEVDPEMPEVRIVRGACNALYEQAGEPTITPERRASIRSGLEACDRLIGALERRSLAASACELELKLRAGHLYWNDFEQSIEGLTA